MGSAILLVALGQPVLAHGASSGRSAIQPVLADRNGNRISDDFEPELAQAQPGSRFRVIVRFTSAGSEASAKRAVGTFIVSRRFSLIRGIEATMTAAQIRGLSADAGTFRIEKDFQVKATMDAARADFGVDAAQTNLGATGAGIEICIVDTGVDTAHEQLDNGKVVAFADFISGQANPYDDQGHGTHVASIVAGDGVGGANASKYRGVAPAAAISMAKSLDSQGNGTDGQVLAGIDWCANRPSARVISMSLGTVEASDGSDSLSADVNRVVTDLGKTVVVAAGNSGDTLMSVGSPGAAENAITVGAVAEYSAPVGAPNHSDGIYLASFSSRGPTVDGRTKPDIVAPGYTITAAQYHTTAGYVEKSGTSMATPFAAGIVALGLQKDPAMTPAAFVSQAAGTAGTTTFPTHTRVTGSVDGNGTWTYSFALTSGDLSIPIGATIILDGQVGCVLPVGNDCWLFGEWEPDLDTELRDPNNNVIASSTCALGSECGVGRQETLHAMPTSAGTYSIRVFPYSGQGGTFALDLSRGPAGSPPPPPNNPPTANAGPDQSVSDSDANGSQSVGLNGSLSGDSDGTIQSYVWSEGGSQIATGETANVNLGIGTHTITLTVTDDGSATGSDQVVVTVMRASPSVHVGDIDATRKATSSSWKATATITVHLANEALAQSGTVSGSWNGGPTVTCALTSRSKGKCSITKTGIPVAQSNITFTVTGISAGVLYAPAYNHDPDGSSDGTSILIVK